MSLWRYRAYCKRVVDGDTMDFMVDLGFGTYKDQRVRLAEVDTAEIYGVPKDSDEYEEGMEHKQFVEDWMPSRKDDGEWPLIIETRKDATGKYGRMLAKVHRSDESELNQDLRDEYPSIETLDE